MSILYIYRGLPASGKTTHAKAWVSEDPGRRAIVCRDDIRLMITGEWSRGKEAQAVKIRDASITALLNSGFDVASVDTNLRSSVYKDVAKLAYTNGHSYQTVNLTDVPVEECLTRNALRIVEGTAGVPHPVIHEMWGKFLRGRQLPLADPEIPGAVIWRPWVPRPDLPKAFILDMDGTVAYNDHGRHWYDWDPRDLLLDRQQTHVIDVIKALRAVTGWRPIVCSGRKERGRGTTREWLFEAFKWYPFEYDLLMRPEDDNQPDDILKAGLLDNFVRGCYDVQCVFDDRDKVVKMWRSLGLTCFQVAEGNF